MEAPVFLIIIIVIRDKERHILRQRIDNAAAQRVFPILQIIQSLRAHGRPLRISLLFTVFRIIVSTSICYTMFCF